MSEPAAGKRDPIRLGRYMLFDELASGGMATVHLGRLLGPVGFSRTVAIKRLHPQHAKDPEFVAMLLDEARVAARIRHPNVVATLDVVATEGEVFLVMEYIEGESLAFVLRLLRESDKRIPPRIAAHIVVGALHGLHAAHEAKSDHGEPLGLVHRDVSPQNILIGVDGVPRVLDFGVAKAAGRLQTTDQGRIKGKLGYMAPEQLAAKTVTRKTDIFAAGVVLWEAITGKRLFRGDDPAEVVGKVLNAPIDAPRNLVPDLPAGLDSAVMKALARRPGKRFDTALEMAEAIEAAVGLMPARQVGEWLKQTAGTRLDERAGKVAEVESASSRVEGDIVASGARQSASANASLSGTEPDPTTGRSEVASVVDGDVGRANRRAFRWLPYAVGAAVVLVPAALFLLTRNRPPRVEPAASVSPSAMSATSAAVAGNRAQASAESASAASPSPAASESASAPAPSASASASPPKASASPKRVHHRYVHRSRPAHPRPTSTASLYSRQ